MDPFGRTRWEDDLPRSKEPSRRRPLRRDLFSRNYGESAADDPGLTFARVGFGLGAFVATFAIVMLLATFLIFLMWFAIACLWPGPSAT